MVYPNTLAINAAKYYYAANYHQTRASTCTIWPAGWC